MPCRRPLLPSLALPGPELPTTCRIQPRPQSPPTAYSTRMQRQRSTIDCVSTRTTLPEIFPDFVRTVAFASRRPNNHSASKTGAHRKPTLIETSSGPRLVKSASDTRTTLIICQESVQKQCAYGYRRYSLSPQYLTEYGPHSPRGCSRSLMTPRLTLFLTL